ncbi:hypothetical protein V9T40_004587 [Parthenolecanium corni]|uniref:Uncharacterized protein n=1 Tax=Parthenolecanium corni TaxID=536013 RepID=A0AAN9TS86_9HEMI
MREMREMREERNKKCEKRNATSSKAVRLRGGGSGHFHGIGNRASCELRRFDVSPQAMRMDEARRGC